MILLSLRTSGTILIARRHKKEVWVKSLSGEEEPRDIARISRVIPQLQRMARIQRAYVADEARAEELERMVDES